MSLRPRFVRAMVRREGRAALRRFGVYGACMAIGIGVVVGLDAVRGGVVEAVDRESRALLGADLRLTGRDEPGPTLAPALAELERLAEAPPTAVTRLGTMVLAEGSGRSRLVDLMAIDGPYPLYGAIRTEPAFVWSRFGERAGTVFVDASLLLQLDVEIGDVLRFGGRRFEVVAAVVKAPGGVGMQSRLAPRIWLTRADLDATDLVQTGTLAEHRLLYRVGAPAAAAWLERFEDLLAESRIRTRTVASHQEELSEAFASLTGFLGLVGLASLLLGAIGVAAGVRVFVQEKRDPVAWLRSLGASPGDVLAVYLCLAAGLGLLAGIIGIVLCIPVVWALPRALEAWLPVEVGLSIGPGAVVAGLSLGLVTTALCAAGPLVDLARTEPLQALRRDFSAESEAGAASWRRRGGGLGVGLLAATGIVAASWWQAGDLRVGLGFALALLLTVGTLAAAGWAMMTVVRKNPPRRAPFWLRQGIANLFRPRNHTLPTTIAIGFALFLVATLIGVQRNLLEQLAQDTRPERPNFVLFDVQSDQRAGVVDLLEARGARVVDEAPIVSARLAALGDRPREVELLDPELSDSKRWALQREYRLTYAERLRETEEIVAGAFWPAEADARATGAGTLVPVSLEDALAETLDLEVGDRVRWTIQGVPLDSRVTSLRRVDWGRMATNFFVVFPPEALARAPQSNVLLAYLPGAEARALLQRDLVVGFPNVSALDATLILESLDLLLGQIGLAIRLLSAFTLATGLAILLAGSFASRRERRREARMLRVLGASRGVLRRVAFAEAFVLSVLAVGVGVFCAGFASWALVRIVFELPFDAPWREWVGLGVAALVGTTLLATGAGLGGRGRTAAAALRETAG